MKPSMEFAWYSYFACWDFCSGARFLTNLSHNERDVV
jgi:hypothetical protein